MTNFLNNIFQFKSLFKILPGVKQNILLLILISFFVSIMDLIGLAFFGSLIILVFKGDTFITELSFFSEFSFEEKLSLLDCL